MSTYHITVTFGPTVSCSPGFLSFSSEENKKKQMHILLNYFIPLKKLNAISKCICHTQHIPSQQTKHCSSIYQSINTPFIHYYLSSFFFWVYEHSLRSYNDLIKKFACPLFPSSKKTQRVKRSDTFHSPSARTHILTQFDWLSGHSMISNPSAQNPLSVTHTLVLGGRQHSLAPSPQRGPSFDLGCK